MTAPSRPPSRRHVLGRLAGTAAAAAAATAVPVVAVERTPPAPAGADGRKSRGYTESEHVQRYYRLARF